MINLAILASGNGTNAEVLASHFKTHKDIKVVLVMSNKADAGVLDRAKKLAVPFSVFTKSDMNSGELLSTLKSNNVDFVILAGFLLKIPSSLTEAYPNRIINIHPSLLPKHGGKGMYGMKVHEAVIQNKEEFSGITIHLVNELYDDGKTLFQKSLKIEKGESPLQLANRIHVLEHKYFAKVVEDYVLNFTLNTASTTD